MKLNRRRLFAVGAGVLGTVAVQSQLTPALGATAVTGERVDSRTNTPGAGAANAPLGANFNQNLDALDYRELQAANASWVRGFFPLPAADEGDPAEHFAIRAIVDAAGRGYGTILSLKFPYYEISFPEPGSEAMAAELARLDRVLPTVLGTVDIITVGNEPFIESLPDERDERLNAFYETVARHVVDFRNANCGGRECGTVLYMGALNRLDLPDRLTPATDRWMTFVRETPDIEGVDLHPHVPDPANVQAFLDYILPRMRDDQTFLVTEFSLVWYWKQHLSDPISAEFADQYGFDPGTLVWQVIESAIDHPFSEQQWNDFLSSCAWFVKQGSFLRDQMALYRGTGRLAAATYGFKQDELMTENFDADKDPWLLNSVFATYTAEPRSSGVSAPSFWIDDFRAVQNLR